MTLKRNFNYIPNSNEGFKNRQNKQTDHMNYNYVNSYMKEDKIDNYNTNFQTQKLSNLANYNTQYKDYDYSTSKLNGIIILYFYQKFKNKIKFYLMIKKKIFLEPRNAFSYDPKTYNPNYNYTPVSNFNMPYKALGGTTNYNENFYKHQKNISTIYQTQQEGGVTYRFFQELKNSKKFKNKLEQFDILSLFNDYSKFEYSRQIALDGENYNINRLIENTKKFFVEENIPYILNYHFENYDNINKIFVETLKIQMIPKMQEEIDNKFFKEEMFKTIHDSYLSFSNDGIFNFFAGKNQTLYEQNQKEANAKNIFFGGNKGNYNDHLRFNLDEKQDLNKIKFSFFYGDNMKIKILMQIIDSKLFLLMKNRLQGNQGTSIKSKYESNYYSNI
jgi:hypothetical protein